MSGHKLRVNQLNQSAESSESNFHTFISFIFLRLFSFSCRKNSPLASSLSICLQKKQNKSMNICALQLMIWDVSCRRGVFIPCCQVEGVGTVCTPSSLSSSWAACVWTHSCGGSLAGISPSSESAAPGRSWALAWSLESEPIETSESQFWFLTG